MSATDGMHADAPDAPVQPEPQARVTCARDRALVILAELVLETRDTMRAAYEKRDVYSMEPHLEKLDRFEGVCREILNPSGRRTSGVERLGREHFVNAGKKGGATLLALRGPEYFAEIGRRGVAARAAKRATARGEQGMIEVPLSRGLVAKIDDEDGPRVLQHRWHAAPRRGAMYAATNRPGRGNGVLYLHRLVLQAPDGIEVDHVNGDGLDNRRENLRLATRDQNAANIHPRTSKPKGIEYVPRKRKWRARIYHEGRFVSLGYFQTPEAAAEAYDNAARRLKGDFARTNSTGGVA